MKPYLTFMFPKQWFISVLFLLGISMLYACADMEDESNGTDPIDNEDQGNGNGNSDEDFALQNISDTYYDIHEIQYHPQWGPYNTHDPSVLNDGNYFYSYSTDAMFGIPVDPYGIQVRRSKDLVDWEFVGWAIDGLPSRGADYIRRNGGEPFESLWAPYILKIDGEYRLYYSLSSPEPKLSAIGLLVSDSPLGPWEERGLVVTSRIDVAMTNAIDPSVVIDQQGRHWMYYGSAYDGIYVMELNPSNGMALLQNDKGKRIAERGYTGNTINGNIEAPEVIYNENFGYYYLFISYDWLETKYNLIVGRSENPDGPFYDIQGRDMNEALDDIPMILAPYAFEGHQGWQGVAHNAMFRDGEQFYTAHQGRPNENYFFMVLHVRQVFWTEEGWPVISPQRYAGKALESVSPDQIAGDWEQIVFEYRVVPGFSEEQVSPDIQRSVSIRLDEDGSINADDNNKWRLEGQNLILEWNDGQWVDELIVHQGYDWENHRSTLLFTGLNQEGTTIWGKKIETNEE